MYQHEIFKNAPIAEALLDVRAKCSGRKLEEGLERFNSVVSEAFPKKQTRVFYETSIEIKEEDPPTYGEPKKKSTRIMLTSEIDGKVIQVGEDGFSFSKLAPYEKWELLRDQAKYYWEIYESCVEVENIERVALRYINRIEIPLPLRDFSDYILTAPTLPEGLPQGLAHFFLRLVIPNEKKKCTAIVNSTLENVSDDGTILPYIMDIDVFRLTSSVPRSEIWEIFETLREYKNDIFFESITEKTRELFR